MGIKAAIIVVAIFLLFIPGGKVRAAESSGTCGDNATWELVGTEAAYNRNRLWPVSGVR
jgi:hypothetical protein